MADVISRCDVFDPILDLPEYWFAIYYGLRRSGKTTMLKHMLNEMKERLDDHKVYLFSTTAELNSDYEYIPKKAKYYNVAEIEQDLGKIINEQKGAIKRFNEGEEGAEEPTPILVILDDCVSEESIRHCPSLNTLAVAGRHIHISVVILSQVVTGSGSVPPIIRTQCDAIFVVANPRSERERAILAEQYLCADNSYNAKRRGLEVLAAATDVQYRALVILTTDSSIRKMEEYLYVYGPVPEKGVAEDFKLGTPEQWDQEEDGRAKKRRRNYNPNEKKKEEEVVALPNPFSFSPDLPNFNGEYLNGLSDNFSRARGRRR